MPPLDVIPASVGEDTGVETTPPPEEDEPLPVEEPPPLTPVGGTLVPPLEENPLADPVACEKHSWTSSLVVWQQRSGSPLFGGAQPGGHAPHRLVMPPS